MHYVCSGTCNATSGEAGVCNAQSCVRHSLPLTACNCTDGQHKDILEAAKYEQHQEHPES